MIVVDIPGFGHLELKNLVCDFSGTLSVDGIMLAGVRERLEQLSSMVDIHILTADTHGKVEEQLAGTNWQLTMLTGENQDAEKSRYVEKLGSETVAAIGNGNNDRKMLAAARIGIAVCLNEGLAIDTLKAATIMTGSIQDALDLLLSPDRLKATLRF